MPTNKSLATIKRAGERLYVYPYAYNPYHNIPGYGKNEILWFQTSEFEPMNIGDSFAYRKFPWIRFHLKNIVYKWQVYFRYQLYKPYLINAFHSLKRGMFKQACSHLKQVVFTYDYYSIYPTFGVEMCPVRLGLDSNLMIDGNVAERIYVTPNTFHILMDLDWQLQKLEAGTLDKYSNYQEDLLAFEVWKNKVYESGNEIRFMCELDT